jgi:hypothetical protein
MKADRIDPATNKDNVSHSFSVHHPCSPQLRPAAAAVGAWGKICTESNLEEEEDYCL